MQLDRRARGRRLSQEAVVLPAAAVLLLLLSRLAHREIIWVEEAYPAAAAIQMWQHGQSLYTDFQFDKPPLSAAVYWLWGGAWGWPMRIAGTLYVVLCAALAFALARRWWPAGDATGQGPEPWYAALFVSFYLTFGTPAAVMALAPDLLTLAPSLAAMFALAASRPGLAGALLGLTIAGLNGKALLLLPLLVLHGSPGERARGLLSAAAGMAAVWLTAPPAMWTQVWEWGAAYSRDSPLASPLREGIVRTLGWAGFQASAIAGAAWLFFSHDRHRRTLAVWLGLSLAMAALGLRFAPRYYLPLLAPLALAASRGLALLPSPRWRLALLALLAVPALRFGPRYLQLAADPHLPTWSDTAMNRDSAHASAIINRRAAPHESIFVWGYRPDILVYTRLRLGAPFLDSQPLTGVIADRHLTASTPTFPALAASNRRRLAAESTPAWIVDGLGPYNPELAITRYPELAEWLAASYDEVAHTAGTRIYRRRRQPAQ